MTLQAGTPGARLARLKSLQSDNAALPVREVRGAEPVRMQAVLEQPPRKVWCGAKHEQCTWRRCSK